jgi:hypothetical protein
VAEVDHGQTAHHEDLGVDDTDINARPADAREIPYTMNGTIEPLGLDAMAVMAATAKIVAGSWLSSDTATRWLTSELAASPDERVRSRPEMIDVVMNTWAVVHSVGHTRVRTSMVVVGSMIVCPRVAAVTPMAAARVPALQSANAPLCDAVRKGGHAHENPADDRDEDAVPVDPDCALGEEELYRDDGESVEDRIPPKHCIERCWRATFETCLLSQDPKRANLPKSYTNARR